MVEFGEMAARQPHVFLLMPFAESFDWLHILIVEEGSAAGAQVERADDIFEAGIVIEQIKGRIERADAIVAVCTGLNPNVFFELGVADQWHWPILLTELTGESPFDVSHYRTLIYGGWDVERIRRWVKASIEDTLKMGRKDRPGVGDTNRAPRPEPRVLGQAMMQVHVWGLEREG